MENYITNVLKNPQMSILFPFERLQVLWGHDNPITNRARLLIKSMKEKFVSPEDLSNNLRFKGIVGEHQNVAHDVWCRTFMTEAVKVEGYDWSKGYTIPVLLVELLRTFYNLVEGAKDGLPEEPLEYIRDIIQFNKVLLHKFQDMVKVTNVWQDRAGHL